MEHRKKQLFHLGVLLAGALVLGVFAYELGWTAITDAVTTTGAWFAVMAVIDLASAGCDAYAIRGFLSPRQHVPYHVVYVAQISGLAINRLTPGNSLGEPVKVTSLAHSVPTKLAVSAIVMFNIVNVYVGIAAIVIGVPITVALLDLPHPVALFVWIATGVLVAIAIAIAVIVRRGAVATLVDLLASTRFVSHERAQKWRGAIADIDKHLRALGGNTRASGLRKGLAGVVGSRVLNWAGTIVLLHAVEIPMTPVLVVAMLSVGILVTWATSIVPLGLGIADGANYVLYDMLGASPEAGFLFTMVNRLRNVLLALIGLAIMAIAHVSRRDRSRPPDPRHSPSPEPRTSHHSPRS